MNWEKLLSARRFSDKSDPGIHDKNRSRFEQDYDRIVFSQPFRKLQDKTQVFPMPEDDFVHTRLTHSLEVSSVGRSLGKNAGLYLLDKYPELKEQFSVNDFGSIVASACLAHDLGNPPFGHAGEDGISSFFRSDEVGMSFQAKVNEKEWKDLTNFEGNAQGFRILNSPLYRGLGLTFASLGAFTKYPLSSSSDKIPARKSQKKFGYYQSEEGLFTEMSSLMGLESLTDSSWCRHPLAFLVEAADDICYGIIDFEDGCRLGMVPFELYRDLLAEIIGSGFSHEKLEKIPSVNERLAILRAMAISQLVKECSDSFKNNEEAMLDGSFDRAITDQIKSSETLATISKLSVEKIYRSRVVLEREVAGFRIIQELLAVFSTSVYEVIFGNPSTYHKTVFALLPEEIQLELRSENVSVYDSLMSVNDYLSSLTDRFASRLHKIITGM